MNRSSAHESTRKPAKRARAFTGLLLLPFTVSALMLGTGCGQDGKATLVSTSPESAGGNCVYGGIRLDTGLDVNRDGVLGSSEVETTAYVCNQRVDGRSTAVRVVAVPAGASCAAGGQRIDTGIDDNDDHVLGDTEVDSSALVCSGTNGVDGFTTRVRLVNIPSGVSGSACPFGGTRIESGPDSDRSGTLDTSEVDSFQSVCSVQVASSLYLTNSVLELAGANCANGGTKMTFGFDDNGNNTLDPTELDGNPVYICNQVILVAGKTSLTVQSAATPAQCTFGGYVYRTGLDDNYDTTLSAGEVDSTAVVCNGQNGYRALVEQTPAPVGMCSGATGYRVRSGLDLDYDGILDANEVTADNLLCNGASIYGLDGRDTLMVQQSVNYTAYCGGPALSVATGLDNNRNGALDANEINQTSYLCAGSSGHNALVEVYQATTNQCYPLGKGLLIRTGTDNNDSGKLDYSEYTESILCQ